MGNTKETPSREILGTRFDLEDYLFLYDDIVKAKLNTEEKAKIHWKSYGHKEARYAAIEVINGGNQSISNNYGFSVSAEVYDTIIELINKQTIRECKDVISELIMDFVEAKTIWRSYPDLIIPAFSNPNNHGKNNQVAVKNGWYYNFYK